jgi:hypothetical protein
MAYDCNKATYFYDSVGFLAVGQKFFTTSNGGDVMQGYYSGNYNGTFYIFTVDAGGYITAMETISSLGCAGTTPDPSPSPIPQGNSLLLAFRTTQGLSCTIGSEISQRTEMWSNANESSLQNVADSITPSDSLIDLNYYMYADVNMTTTKNNGYYSDGNYWYRVYGGAGKIIDAGRC